MPSIRDFFIANAPDDLIADDLRDMFADWGEITAFEPFVDNESGPKPGCYFLWLETQGRRFEIMTALNGYPLGDYRLTVTPGEINQRKARYRLPTDKWIFVKEIGAVLGEEKMYALMHIADFYRIGSPSFVRVMAEKALEIEEAGGMMLPNGKRRRTVGGVYFFLSKNSVSPSVLQLLLQWRWRPEKPASGTAPDEADAAQADAETESRPDPLVAVRAELAALQRDLQEAKQDLEAIQTGQRRGGLLTVTKRVVDLQREIDALLDAYSQLG